jgi:uncharacterized protein YndB with AHSA1/START domain
MNNESTITVQTTVNAPVEKVWRLWSQPEHITKWNSPSADWHTLRAENDLRTGGKFMSRMEAKDGSMGFDFGGVYDDIRENEHIAYTMDDGRKVTVDFTADGDQTRVVETFDPESENPREMQHAGWQAILDSFKRYAEEQ